MTEERYRLWIEDYAQNNYIQGRCLQVCLKMQEAFPELMLKGGYARLPLGLDLHFWLVTTEGHIVDPTASQYGGLLPEQYEDADSTDPMQLLKRFLHFA